MDKNVEKGPSDSTTKGSMNTKYIVFGVVGFVVFCIALALIHKIYYDDRKNNPPKADVIDPNTTLALKDKIASLSANIGFLSYNVSTNAVNINKLIVDLNSVKNISLAPTLSSDIALLKKDVSNFAVSQSALYSQLKTWANTDYMSSAIATLLNRVDTRAQNEKQMISVEAGGQQVAQNGNVIFNDPTYNSNSIVGDIVLKDRNTFALKPGIYFVTLILTAEMESSFFFVSTDDGSTVDGSEITTPILTSTAFVLEIPKESGEYSFAMRNKSGTDVNITRANAIIFTL